MIRATWIGFQPGEGSINETFNIFDSPLAEERRREGEKKRIVPKHGCKFGSYTNLRSRDSSSKGKGRVFVSNNRRFISSPSYPPRLYDRLLRTARSYLNLGYTASGRPCVTRSHTTQNPIVRYTHWSVQRRIITCVAIVKIAGDLGDSVVSRVTEKSNGRYAEEFRAVTDTTDDGRVADHPPNLGSRI